MSCQLIRKFVFSCLILGLGLCPFSAQAQFALSSPAFVEGGTIPNEFVCIGHYGKNWSPPLNIGGTPRNAESLALVMRDVSADGFLHWIAWNIDPQATSLPYNVSQGALFEQGTNDSGARGYFGPCPSCTAESCEPHIYQFRLYALNTRFAAQPSEEELMEAAVSMSSLRASRSVFDSINWLPESDDVQVSSIVNGPIERQVISARFVPRDRDIGAQIMVFVAANVAIDGNPANLWMTWMTLDSNDQWRPFTGCDGTAAVRSGRFLAEPAVIPIVGTATDLRPVLNTELFVGYGLGTDSAAACEEMLQQGRFKQIYTVR